MSRFVPRIMLALACSLPQSVSAATFGFIDDFAAAGTNGWGGGTSVNNPGAGEAGGAADGFLGISQGFDANFGARSTNVNYQGDWVAAGISRMSLRLNDIGTDDAFEIHVLISDGTFATSWQYNIGFAPPSNCWGHFVVDLADESKWTRIRGTSSFQSVLQNVERITIRHDLAPYVDFPDGISGDLGIDQIQLDEAPAVCSDPFADVDSDGDVDQEDFAVLQRCLVGGCLLAASGCACFDRDVDGDVDSDDWAAFEACVSGPMIPADPACDD